MWLLIGLVWLVIAFVVYGRATPIAHMMTTVGLLGCALTGKYLWLGVLFWLMNFGAWYATSNPLNTSPYYYNSMLRSVVTLVSAIGFLGLLFRLSVVVYRFFFVS